MDNVITLFQSRVIWTNIIGTIASIAAVWGLNLAPDTQATIVTVIIGLTGVLSSFFRVKATAVIVPSSQAK